MLTPVRLKTMQLAARHIESDGAAGIKPAAMLVGEDEAMAMLVMHLRRNLGSTETYPADPAIEERVLASLKEEALV